VKLKLLAVTVLVLVSASAALSQARYPQQAKNAALRYWMAFAEMQDPPADKETQELLGKTSEGKAAWDEAKLGPILDANGAAIRTMQRATKLPDCDWGIEYDRGPRAALSYVPRARVMARLNQLQGIREMAKGDSQAAVNTWLAGLQFAQHLASDGPLLLALVAKAAILPDLRVLTTEARQGHLSNAEKAQVSAAVGRLRADGLHWAAAWGLEELTLDQVFGEIRHAANPKESYELLVGEPMPSGANVPSAEDLRKFHEYMTVVQTALNLPPQAAKARLSALEAQKRSLAGAVLRLIPSAQKVNDNRLEVITAREELLEALARR